MEAVACYRKALEINPANANAHYNLGNALLQLGQTEEAVAEYRETVRINPADADAHLNLGRTLFQQGQADGAIAHAGKALELQPGNFFIKSDLAWMLATAPQAPLRNGVKALELAMSARQASGGKNPVILHTLAAAQAETGQFADAVQTAQNALQLAEAQSNAGLVTTLRREIKLYEAGRRYEAGQ